MLKSNKMSEETLYNSVGNSGDVLLKNVNDSSQTSCCCCISYKWCFDHTGLAVASEYDETECNCCTCFDCCSWCLEFRVKKWFLCTKGTNCYLCCCSIYFIE
jgi:hypothetical protein